jgi:predicted Zn-dependent peptidase
MQILNKIFTAGESSKLYNEMVYNSQMANEAESMIYGMEHISIFFVNLIARKGVKVEELEMKFDDILERIKNGNISDEEIQKAKNKLETGYFAKFSSSVFLSEKLSEYKTLFGNYESLINEINMYESINRNNIINISNKYLNKNQRVNLSYLPKE